MSGRHLLLAFAALLLAALALAGAAEATHAPNLTATPTQGAPPLAVTFTIAHAEGGVQWWLEYGDGATYPASGTSNKKTDTASHTYSAAGSYTAVLHSTKNTETADVPVTIVVNHAPSASFVATPSALRAEVDAAASSDPDGHALTYAWSWGDGSAAGSGATAAHDYAAAGTYTLTLTVTDPLGGSATTSRTVTVNRAPVPAIAASVSGLSAEADGSGSTDADGHGLSYVWDWGDDTTSTGVLASHTYAAAGTYVVRLTVTDTFGASASVTRSVVANRNPLAVFAASASGLGVTVDGSTSSDADGQALAFAWDFGDGATATGPTPPAHTYAAAGTYTLRLTVTDTLGATSSATRTVTANRAPAAAFAVAADGRTVAVDASGSSDPDGQALAFAWTWGDGATATGATAARTYAAAGEYTINLTVTDPLGGTATATRTVLANAAPTAALSAPTGAVKVGSTVTFTVTVTDADGDAVGWALDADGDGQADVTGFGSRDADFTFVSTGDFTSRLVATDPWSPAPDVTAAVSVAADAPPQVSLSPATASGAAPFTVSLTPTASDADGMILNWTFDAGDGSPLVSGAGAPPVLSPTYDTVGTYTATVAVWDDGGIRVVATATIDVTSGSGQRAPLAWLNLTLAPSARPPRDVAARVEAHDPDGDALTWTLAWGDGASAGPHADAARDLTHQFVAAGSYTLRLTVTDATGASRVVLATVAVTAWSPTIAVSASSGEAPLSVTFDLAAASVTGVTSLRFDSGIVDLSIGRQPYRVTVRYSSAGTYPVALELRDAHGNVERATAVITVNDRPQVTLTPSVTSGHGPLDVSYVVAITDSDDVSWTLAFGDGEQASGTEKVRTLPHAYAGGAYRAWLNATDAKGATTSTSVWIDVNPRPAAALLVDGAAGTVRGTAPFAPPLAWSIMDDDAVEWTLDFGDGRRSTGSTPSGEIGHAYAPGVWTARLNVTDADGGVTSVVVEVVVNARPEARLFVAGGMSGAHRVNEDHAVELAWAIVDDGPVTWRVDFGNGTVRTGTAASGSTMAAFRVLGLADRTRVLWLNVTDSENVTASVFRVVTVNPRPGLGVWVNGNPEPSSLVLTAPRPIALEWLIAHQDEATWRLYLDGSEIANGTDIAGARELELLPGAHALRLVVEDAAGAATEYTLPVNVNAPPRASLDLAGARGIGALNVTLSIGIEDDDEVAWSIDFGDGETRNGTSRLATFSHVYRTAGERVVRLVVRDAPGAAAYVNATVLSIAPPAPLLEGNAGGTFAHLGILSGRATARFQTDLPPEVARWSLAVRDRSGTLVRTAEGEGPVDLELQFAEADYYSAVLTLYDGDGRPLGEVTRTLSVTQSPLKPWLMMSVMLAGGLGLTTAVAWSQRQSLADWALRTARRVVRPAAKAPPVPAPESQRCDLCLGAYKTGAPVHRCACGVSLHLSCFERVGACPACGATSGVPA